MIVIPFTLARTSRRRFTLLKVFNAAEISSFEIPHPAAIAAAADAFHTLYSPPTAYSNSAHGFPSRITDHAVRPGSKCRSVIRQVAFALEPYRSTGQNARARHRSRLSPVSK